MLGFLRLASRRGLGPLSPLDLCSSGCAVRWQSELSALKALGTRAQEKALTASMVETSLGENGRTSLMFSTGEGAGSLMEVLGVFKRHGVNLTRIESRPSKRGSTFDFTVDTDMPPPTALLGELRLYTLSLLQPKRVPWFPTVLKDIDVFSTRTLDAGSELEADHPGFSDATYRERRRAIVAAAGGYRHGDSIPSVAYTPEEEATWGIVYNNLRRYTRDFACDAYNRVFPLLEQHCGYSPGRIPQLQHISDFLSSCTGFRLRPVGGLLSARDFLNGLAFRVFFSTQYIRHHSVPLYTPEPDVCHELLGHVPMFADPDFADFSHDIGLASLGASDEDIKRLAACYWFSVEFGLCMEAGQRKAYGAGLLSSFGELEYACASYRPAGGEHSIPSYVPWEPSLAARQAYPICKYQPVLFVADSLENAKERMLAFCETEMARPFRVRYNPLTSSITTDRAVLRDAYPG